LENPQHLPLENRFNGFLSFPTLFSATQLPPVLSSTFGISYTSAWFHNHPMLPFAVCLLHYTFR